MVSGLSQEYNILVGVALVLSVVEEEATKLLADSDMKKRGLL